MVHPGLMDRPGIMEFPHLPRKSLNITQKPQNFLHFQISFSLLNSDPLSLTFPHLSLRFSLLRPLPAKLRPPVGSQHPAEHVHAHHHRWVTGFPPENARKPSKLQFPTSLGFWLRSGSSGHRWPLSSRLWTLLFRPVNFPSEVRPRYGREVTGK